MDAGQEAGCEAAVHAMQSLFHSSSTQAVLLADASNAFNSLNRRASLHNIHFICPPLAITLANVYRKSSSLFIDGERILSEELRDYSGGPLGYDHVRTVYCSSTK